MPDPRAVVEAEEVWKRYGSNHVLRGVDLAVSEGEVVSIIGPSGSGKSTLLRCLNHLESIDAGSIRVNGELMGYVKQSDGRLRALGQRALSKQRTDIGMVFQSFNLYLHMTVTENVTLAPTVVRKTDPKTARAEAQQLLAQVGLSDKVDAYPKQL